MTSPPVALAVASAGSERPLRERRKAVFVCPQCTHTSPYDGDWEYVERTDGTAVRCPVCHEQITFRPDF
jgi:predicted RNA-binding Zn-ribbon protein involved in translation (DUF1610 family)